MVSKNPFKTLFNSRKFWVLLFDLVTSMLIYFVGKYAQAALADLKFIILAIQPIFLLIIATIYGQNVQAMKSQADVESSKSYYLSETAVVEIRDLLKTLKDQKAEISDNLNLPKDGFPE